MRKAASAKIFIMPRKMAGSEMALTAAPMSVVLSEVDDGEDDDDNVGVSRANGGGGGGANGDGGGGAYKTTVVGTTTLSAVTSESPEL